MGLMKVDVMMVEFIAQAICEFAKEVVKANPGDITKATNGFVNGDVWIACAKKALRERRIR